MNQQIPAELLRKCVFLSGPTASGKTEVSLELADRIGPTEVVSLDSMCIFRGMDIGTAKPEPEVQQRFRHHLIDLRDPHEEFSVADYIAAARDAVTGILERGSTPLFVGGTGLYLRSVLRGVFEGPPADWGIRERLQKLADDAATKGDNYWLMRQLEKVDPDSALRLHPNDQRRLIRALEVFEVTGQPLSQQQQQPPLPETDRPPHVYWLSPPRDWLHERINRRVELMLERGLVEEVRRLIQLPHPIAQTAAQGLGYKEVIELLGDEPERSLTAAQLIELTELIQSRTRQFAKRQHTWFRNMDECHELEMTGTETPAELADRIAELIRPR